jgi:acyl-CoA synthetase (AMP-forming)/AMP-acid ligase II/acyl carrier protein
VRLRDWLLAQQITICFLPTPLAEQLLGLAWPAASALRVMLTGGDRLRQYPASTLPFALVNNYGPTENTIVTTSGVVPRQAHAAGAPSIGRPIANTQAYVLDRHLQPVPIGVPGELYIGGAGLARGYLHRPDLTAKQFIVNPFADERPTSDAHRPAPENALIQSVVGSQLWQDRIYKTGDLVRYRADGELEFLGRLDQQVKIRGFRIELGEIEAVLGQHAAVHEAVVVVREDTPSDPRLVAYVVPSDDHGSSTTGTPDAGDPSLVIAELRHFLRAKLPNYMVPAAFVLMDTLPVTPNGKIDRRALLALADARSELIAIYVAPRTPAEELLASLWAEVLGVAQVGVHDNFFDLGGHSLLATRLIAQLRETFQVELPLRALFEHPTVATQVAVVEQACQAARSRDDRIAAMLAKIQQLSDDEARALLNEKLLARAVSYD